MNKVKEPTKYVVCLSNDDYPASLEARKIYRTVPDPNALERGMLRVIDESGEDYLYPKELFASIDVPTALAESFAEAS